MLARTIVPATLTNTRYNTSEALSGLAHTVAHMAKHVCSYEEVSARRQSKQRLPATLARELQHDRRKWPLRQQDSEFIVDPHRESSWVHTQCGGCHRVYSSGVSGLRSASHAQCTDSHTARPLRPPDHHEHSVRDVAPVGGGHSPPSYGIHGYQARHCLM